MIRVKLPLILLVLSASVGLLGVGRASEPPTVEPPEQASDQAADKWQYTLFNPVPADKLRDMDTDRPNVTNTPHTVDAGHLQIETGVFDYSYYRDHLLGADTHTDTFNFGDMNFRLGLLNNLEVNVVVNGFSAVETRDFVAATNQRHLRFGDTVVGGKLNLWGNDGADAVGATAFAIQPQFKIPTAPDSIGNGRFECTVNFPFLENLPNNCHLGYQPTILDERNTSNTGYVAGMGNSISLDHVLPSKLDVYLEYASEVTTEKHTNPLQTIDIGGTYPFDKNVVLDSGLNFGLNKATNNIEAQAGISIRF